MKRFVVISTIVVLTCSCEKVIEPGDLPEQDTRMVINTVLDPDSVFNVTLSQSKSIISGKEYKMVDNEACSVFDGETLVEQLSFVAKGVYKGKLKPQFGKTYTIRANSKNFPDVSGTSAVPLAPQVISVERVDTVSFALFSNANSNATSALFGSLKFKIVLKDNPGIADYYGVAISGFVTDTGGTEVFDLPLYLTLSNGSNGGNNSAFYFNGLFGTDKESTSSGEKTFLAESTIFNGDIPFKGPFLIQLFLRATTISEDYYKYLATASKQLSTSGSIFAEPTVIYSNCTNGMGIVGGRASTIQPIKTIVVK